MIFITGTGTSGALPELVSTIVVIVLSEGGDDALISPRNTGASWTISCLISEVTIRASEIGIVMTLG